MKSSGDMNFHDMVDKYCLLQNSGGRRTLPRNILATLLIIFSCFYFSIWIKSTKKNERKGQSETTIVEVKNYSKNSLV